MHFCWNFSLSKNVFVGIFFSKNLEEKIQILGTDDFFYQIFASVCGKIVFCFFKNDAVISDYLIY